MSGSHKNLQLFSVVRETTSGTTPSAALQKINVGSSSPSIVRNRQKQAPSYVTSGSLLPYKGIVLKDDGTAAVPETPLQYDNMYLLHESVYASDRTTVAEVSATDISVASNVMSSVGNDFGNLAVGDCLYITFANSGDGTTGVYGPLLAAAAGSITFPAGQLADFSAGNTVTINDFKRLTPGTELNTHSVEHQMSGLTNYFKPATYGLTDSHTFSWSAGGNFATESSTMTCRPSAKASSTIGTGAASDAPTSDPMSSGNDFGTLFLAEATTNLTASVTFSSIDITVARTNGYSDSVGSDTFGGACAGELSVTGTINMLLDDNSAAIIDEAEDNDSLWMRWDVVDAQGNRMIFYQSAVTLEIPAEGESNNLIHQPFPFMAHDPLKETGWVNNVTGMPMSAIFYVPA